MDKTLLILGDECDWASYNRFCKEIRKNGSNNLDTIIATYKQLELNQLPAIESDSIMIYLFFPFEYWDENIEHEGYQGVYGNSEFYKKFRAFWTEINRMLNTSYNGKKLCFINHPLRISADRDKELTKTILAKAGIEVPVQIFTRNYADILRLVNGGEKKLFLKVRYGSMGKGITYLEKGKWKTNFRFEDGEIVSRHSDRGWTFIDITNNIDFLKVLLTKDIIIEEVVDAPLINGLKFDLRVYTCFGKVLYIYLRTNKKEAITTNISQGGQKRNASFLKKLPEHVIQKVSQTAVKATKALGLDFAGVDIMISKDLKHAYVIELNAFPNIIKTRGFNLSRRIIKKIEEHICALSTQKF